MELKDLHRREIVAENSHPDIRGHATLIIKGTDRCLVALADLLRQVATTHEGHPSAQIILPDGTWCLVRKWVDGESIGT